MPPKAPATPEERAARMAAKGFPAWARDYIGQLEAGWLTLHQQNEELKRQVQQLAGLPGTDHKHSPEELGGAVAEQMRHHIAAVHWRGQSPGQGLDSWGLGPLHAYHNGLHDGYGTGHQAAPQLPEGLELSAIGAIFGGKYQAYLTRNHSHAAGTEVLCVESHGHLMTIRLVAHNEIIIEGGEP